jgi:hypothetical protein
VLKSKPAMPGIVPEVLSELSFPAPPEIGLETGQQ